MSDAADTEEKEIKKTWSPLDALQALGATIIGFLGAVGRLAMFTGQGIYHCFTPPFYPRLLLRQIIDIGY